MWVTGSTVGTLTLTLLTATYSSLEHCAAFAHSVREAATSRERTRQRCPSNPA
jgi:hypothetical protein